ncbi:MAG TPA: TetR family transcriptional regulator [Candidatus Dormibacteraeota bacterium]|nr:TetR family transcriptional regulator [Candidatus Dormibacteraeota bacterium]
MSSVAGRIEAKRRAILAAAAQVFAAEGFERGRIDDVAAAAGVSKQTVYNHFGDKRGLVLAAIAETQGTAVVDVGFRLEEIPPVSEDVDAAFATIGRALVGIIADRQLSAMRRMVNLERGRHPELRAAWMGVGPVSTLQWLITFISGLAERGELDVEVPARAAGQLVALVGAEANERSLWGVRPMPEEIVADLVRVQVGTYLRAYSARRRPIPGPSPARPEASPPRAMPGRGRDGPHRAILEAAAEVFREAGYEGAGVDVIAERAGVSKQTLYNHFGAKDQLLLATVEAVVRGVEVELEPVVVALAGAGEDPERALRRAGAAAIRHVVAPEMEALRSLVAFEVARHPGLVDAWRGGGVLPLTRALTAYFAALAGSGRVAVTDPGIPARQLVALSVTEARNLAEVAALDQVRDLVAEGTADFLLRAYRR